MMMTITIDNNGLNRGGISDRSAVVGHKGGEIVYQDRGIAGYLSFRDGCSNFGPEKE